MLAKTLQFNLLYSDPQSSSPRAMEGINLNDNNVAPSRPQMSSFSPATQGIHADDHLARQADVAPAMHVSTTFRYSDDPSKLEPCHDDHVRVPADPSITPTDLLVYSRLTAPNTTRLESVLSSILHGRALTYSSGLSAFHALLVFLNPKRIAIGAGYHGCHGVIGLVTKLTGLKKVDIHGSDADWDAAGLTTGDVVHIETPLNPSGEAYDISSLAARAHKRGCIVTVDATLGPPGLQDPFAHGADIIMHSGTKYLGGHSDMLCGVLAVRRDDWWWGLYGERLHLGSVMGSFEGWLGLRSLRTLELRVRRQSDNATALARWLHSAFTGVATDNTALPAPTDAHKTLVQATVQSIQHASLQALDPANAPWLAKQMPSGYGPVFALSLKTSQMARTLPSRLALFHHATSLGGVESLIEWRRMSDPDVDDRLLRLSIGAEDVRDLLADLVGALEGVWELTV